MSNKWFKIKIPNYTNAIIISDDWYKINNKNIYVLYDTMFWMDSIQTKY
jgi:hypothetical protein